MSYKVITFFSDVQFQSLLVFPYLDIKKQANYWNVKIAISKLLYEYPYSFAFPNTFLNYQNIYDLQVKIKIIESLSTVSLEKVFYVEVFLQRFNISTQKKKNQKKVLV